MLVSHGRGDGSGSAPARSSRWTSTARGSRGRRRDRDRALHVGVLPGADDAVLGRDLLRHRPIISAARWGASPDTIPAWRPWPSPTCRASRSSTARRRSSRCPGCRRRSAAGQSCGSKRGSRPLAFSGNKLRNLEFLLGPRRDGADTIVTSGRRWSNHCRLTAAAGARLGLEVHVVLTGPRVDRSGQPRPDRAAGRKRARDSDGRPSRTRGARRVRG